MHILGTAGHVDHGKSSLVRALTGTDPDRWIEERLRGMTLDLGFAHLRFDDGVEAGVVDVPGHERFLHNMLAGAAGMELLLLAVAANEGPRPQTLEHLAILQYLNVRRAIVVLTKADLVDAEGLAFAEDLVREAAAGTIVENAPVLAVSTVTGAGLDALRAAIHAALVALPPRAPDAPAYLPIDRVFALPGHGTIVTGTLMQGRIAVGDRLALAPSGREVRVRSLQVFGERRERVDGGARVAANLPGLETSDVARGAVLASSQFVTRATFDVRFRPLRHAVPSLKRRTPVRVYIGSAEILGTLVFEQLPADASEHSARLFLREPTVVFPGAAFVVRRLSPKHLLGGGVVSADAGAAPPAATSDVDADADAVAIAAALRAAGFAGATAAQIGAAANVREDRVAGVLAASVDDGRAVKLAKPPAFLDGGLARDTFERARAVLETRQLETPWTLGATSLALSRALGIAEATLVRVLTVFVDEGSLAYRAGYYATPAFVPELTAEQRAFFAVAFPRETASSLVPVALVDVLAGLRASKVAGVSQAFDTLLASGALVKVATDVYRADQIATIRAKLETALRARGELTMAEFRDLTGTSRKYAVPLLEWFDAISVTLRRGDVRVLRQSTRVESTPRS